MSIGLVHDYLLVMRGAERTFVAIADCWESAEVYTLVYDPDATREHFPGRRITSSYLQKLGLRQHNFRRALPLFPRAAESLRVGGHDVIISSSSAFAHGVEVAEGSVHVCYCHSPFRYVWHERERACSEVSPLLRPVLRGVLGRVRDWDRRASAGVTHYIANSQTTRRRIEQFYGRDASVVHPPVRTDRFAPEEPHDYALVVTELVPHKRVEMALEAARRAGMPIKVVGTGPHLPALEARFGGSAEFLGRVSDAALCRLYAHARVFVMANVEEFGIAAVEAQAAGTPVVAVAAGGALETIVPGETGVLVPEDDTDALAEVLRYTDFERFSRALARRNAHRFSVSAFKARMREEVAQATGTSERLDHERRLHKRVAPRRTDAVAGG